MSKAVIHADFATLMVSGFVRENLPLDHLFAGARINLAEIGRPDYRLTQQQFSTLLRGLTRASRDELWCLGNNPLPLGTFKTMCELVIRCPTLEDAIRAGCRLYHVVTRDFVVRYRRDGPSACIRITDSITDEAQRRVIHGVVVFFIYGFMCWLVGRRIPLSSVSFEFPRRAYNDALLSVYQSDVRFDEKCTELCFDARWLTLPPVPDERRLTRFLNALPGNLVLGYRDELSYTERVQAVLRQRLENSPSLDDVATLLNTTSATLRRRLQEESNVGFQSIKDRVRHRAAVELMQSGHMTLTEIAWKLGFAELSTFHRAFKRWTGSNPSDFVMRSEAQSRDT